MPKLAYCLVHVFEGEKTSDSLVGPWYLDNCNMEPILFSTISGLCMTSY